MIRDGASPIFIRTELVEPDPIAAVTVATQTPTAASRTPPVAPASPTAEPSVRASAAPAVPAASATATPAPRTPLPFAPAARLSGSFTGTDDFHFGRGRRRSSRRHPGRYHLRLEDFSVRNGPDLYVYLSPDRVGLREGALESGKLKATDGAFGYDLPAGTDPADSASAIIWCKQFSHLFAVAPFEPCLTRPRETRKSGLVQRYDRPRTIPPANATEASVART